MTGATVAGCRFEFDAAIMESALDLVESEPINEHYVIVGGRRFPPKQALAVVTGLDRADFTTHQARAVLRRLGFGVHRLTVFPTRLAFRNVLVSRSAAQRSTRRSTRS